MDETTRQVYQGWVMRGVQDHGTRESMHGLLSTGCKRLMRVDAGLEPDVPNRYSRR